MIHLLDLQFRGNPQTIAAFLVETAQGPVLIETGPHSCLPALEKGLDNLGYRLADIRHALLTHIHLDHAGAAWVLAREGATVYVHPAGKKHLVDPSRLLQSARRIYQDQMDSLWGTLEPIPENQIRVMEQGETLDIGGRSFRAWHTPGHAVHHIAWQLDSDLFTGDVAGVRIGQGPVVPPCPPPDIDLEAWNQSIRLMRELPVNRLWLTHFGPVDNPGTHLRDLEKRMWKYAEWILPFYERGESPEAITPAFESMTGAELQAAGLDELGLVQYENANPSWMSVGGLLRYWEKKKAEL